MRIITEQLIRCYSSVPLEEVEFLDLSGKLLCDIGGVAVCPKIHTLILRENNIEFLRNLEPCVHLWNIDLTGNRLKILSGLTCFPILGSLRLGSNELDWESLGPIRPITILKLSLAGNSKLDSDHHYRKHAVSVLPNVWVLDGIQITEKERNEVDKFFKRTEKSSRPVRPKLAKHFFIPTHVKKVFQAGAIGTSARHLMSEFPPNFIQTEEWDRRRLSYLLFLVEEDIKMAQNYYNNLKSRDIPHLLRRIETIPSLQGLLEARNQPGNKERASMLLLLTIAGLEFKLSTEILETTFEVINLQTLEELRCIELFKIPPELTRDVVSILISAEKLDKDFKIDDGGLYEKLFASLCYGIEHQFSKPTRKPSEPVMWRNKMEPKKPPRLTKEVVAEWNSVVACEVVQLMCMVPPFLDAVRTDPDLMEIITKAKQDVHVPDMIQYFLWKTDKTQGGLFQYYREMSKYMHGTGKIVYMKQQQSGVHRTSSEIFSAYKTNGSTKKGKHSPSKEASPKPKDQGARATPKSAYERRESRKPVPGDIVHVDNKFYTKIVAVPQGIIAVIKHDPLEMRIKPQDGFFFCDVSELNWDKQHRYWVTSLSNSSQASFRSCLTGSRKAPPKRSSHEGIPIPDKLPSTRPYSGQSLQSEDLQTIPSQEELLEEEGEMQMHKRVFALAAFQEDSPSKHFPAVPHSSPATTVNNPTANHPPEESSLSLVSVTSETEFQRSILQEYSGTANAKKMGTLKVPSESPKAPADFVDKTEEPQPQMVQNPDIERKASPQDDMENHEDGRSFLLIPTPRVKLPETWDVKKAIPPPESPALSESSTHSCMLKDAQALSLDEFDPTKVPKPLKIADAFAALNFSPETGKPDIAVQPCQYHYMTDRERVLAERFRARYIAISDMIHPSASAASLNSSPYESMAALEQREPLREPQKQYSRQSSRFRRAPTHSRPGTSNTLIEVRGVNNRRLLSQHSSPYLFGNNSIPTEEEWWQNQKERNFPHKSARRTSRRGPGVRKLGGGLLD